MDDERRIKKKLIVIYELICLGIVRFKKKICSIERYLFYQVPIMNAEKTARYIKERRCSVSRYGDGEFGLALGEWETGFQKKDKILQEKLLNALKSENNTLVCIPHYFSNMFGAKKEVKQIWNGIRCNNNRQIRVVKILRKKNGKKYIYGDSLISRPYMDMKSPKHASKVFTLLKKIWENEDVLIVEGEQTRLGIGNDLFDKAKSVRRILAPSMNAFSVYNDLIEVIKKHYHGGLILLALGPTATILAADLAAKGMWAVDIGHLDVEYEWYLQNAKKKVALIGKYVNEVVDGCEPQDCKDKVYLSQIADRVN